MIRDYLAHCTVVAVATGTTYPYVSIEGGFLARELIYLALPKARCQESIGMFTAARRAIFHLPLSVARLHPQLQIVMGGYQVHSGRGRHCRYVIQWRYAARAAS